MCPPCDNEMKSEAIVEHLCASEFGKEEHWGHRETFLGGTGQHRSCLGQILHHPESRAASTVAGVAMSPVGNCGPCPRQGQRASRCQCQPAEASSWTGWDWTCPGRVWLLQPSTPRGWDCGDQDSGVLAVVPALLHHPSCGAEHPPAPPGEMQRGTRSLCAGSPAEAAMLQKQ